MRVELLETIDPKTAAQLAKLTTATYDGTYYDTELLGDGHGWQNNEKEKVFIATEDDGRVVGVSSIADVAPSVALLHRTIVHPQYQGNGVGSKLNSARKAYLDQSPETMVLVENRAHETGSYVPVYKKVGLIPVTLGPYDVLPLDEGQYRREYYYVGYKGPTLAVEPFDPSNNAASQFVEQWRDNISVQRGTEDSLLKYYDTHPYRGRMADVFGGRIGVFTPRELLVNNAVLEQGINTAIYVTGFEEETFNGLSEQGYKFNGLKPFIDIPSIDGRKYDPNSVVDSFWLFTKVVDDKADIRPPQDPRTIQGLSPELQNKLILLFDASKL